MTVPDVLQNVSDTPQKSFFSGRHYSDSDMPEGFIDGSRRGAARKDGTTAGAEGNRLSLGRGAPAGSYVYDSNSVGEPGITNRKNVHVVQGMKAILDISDSDIWQNAFSQAQSEAMQAGYDKSAATGIATNEAERAVQRAGYDGYRNTKSHHPGIVFLFGDQQISGREPAPPEQISPPQATSQGGSKGQAQRSRNRSPQPKL